MRHGKLRTKLNRTKSHRKATVNNIIRGLLSHERVITTVKKAKVTSSWADKLITIAKTNNLASIRKAQSLLQDRDLVHKLFNEIGPRYANRQGGYTRVIKYNRRRGDGTQMAILELTEKAIMPATEPVKKETKTVDKTPDAVEPKDVVDVKPAGDDAVKTDESTDELKENQSSTETVAENDSAGDNEVKTEE